jgi:hypothetical protein
MDTFLSPRIIIFLFKGGLPRIMEDGVMTWKIRKTTCRDVKQGEGLMGPQLRTPAKTNFYQGSLFPASPPQARNPLTGEKP